VQGSWYLSSPDNHRTRFTWVLSTFSTVCSFLLTLPTLIFHQRHSFSPNTRYYFDLFMARFSLLSVVLALISLLSLSSWARPAACRPRYVTHFGVFHRCVLMHSGSPRPQPGSPQLAPSGTHQPAPTSTTPTGTPQPTPDQTPPPAPGRNNVYLSEHNEFRARHGAAPLQWSDNLAQKAQQWANNCQFRHSGGSLGPFGGELLAAR
jgi:hypothetical protein